MPRRPAQRLILRRSNAPGRVWAMDFSEPPEPIESVYAFVLHARDLASGEHLAALPVACATAATVLGLLRTLCRVTDPSLVLKVDNGSAFRSAELAAWAAAAGVYLLHSPPVCPRYNGAIEASIASIATRTHHGAIAAGRPGVWTCEDVETARQAANAIIRAPDRRTAAQRWQAARPITARERRRFRCAYVAQHRRMMGVPLRVHQRIALVETLQQLGYVSITRRADLVHQLRRKKRQNFRA
jgi:hypothetical protein